MHVVPKLGTGKDKASSKLHDAGFTHCHQGRSQDFLKGGSHCVKQRVLTRLWCFRHLNIVGCLLKKRLTKGGGGHEHPMAKGVVQASAHHVIIDSFT